MRAALQQAPAPTPVVRVPAQIQRCGGIQCPAGTCDHGGEETVHRSVDGTSDHSKVPSSVLTTLGTPGLPLDTGTRTSMEGRFGHHFGQVRVHSDAAAARSAQAIDAHAYTFGSHIVMGPGRYQPHTPAGQRLLAHELAHVVQQGEHQVTVPQARLAVSTPGDVGERAADAVADAVLGGGAMPEIAAAPAALQRACGAALGAPTPECTPSAEVGVAGWAFMFKVNCDELLPGEEAKLGRLKSGSRLRIHGFASSEGPAGFNTDLSCHRANLIAGLARTLRPDCLVDGTFAHGASPVSGPGTVPDPNPPSFWRTVVVEEIAAPSQPAQPGGACGPDATDWLIAQVVAAKKNARVLNVRSKLDIAAYFAPLIAPSAHLDAMDMLEGQELNMIGKSWQAAGRPPPTADANQQMSEPSATFGVAELTVAETAVAALNVEALTTLTALRDAAKGWVALVGTKRPYDFKHDPKTMQDPRSPHCPDTDCRGTITLCPGSPGSNCFEKDLPGNVLFANVGAFVGFSENALQLGSQWAQLQPNAGSHWDPPEDTAMIHWAYHLPTPLTRAAFCAELQGAKSSLVTHPCKDCREASGASVVEP